MIKYFLKLRYQHTGWLIFLSVTNFYISSLFSSYFQFVLIIIGVDGEFILYYSTFSCDTCHQMVDHG